MTAKERLGKRARATNLFKISWSMRTLNNQKQMQTKRLSDVDLEE